MAQCARGPSRCGRCDGTLPFEFTMAFQPIVDVGKETIVAHEALVRGPRGESAHSILSRVTDDLLYRFDQACRVRAIELASQLGMTQALSINFLPNAVYDPEACIQATLEVSERVAWPAQRLIFEITETERVVDRGHLQSIVDTYRALGFTVALDDFGTGYANLDLLGELQPDRLKIDRSLIMGCDRDKRRQAILNGVASTARELGIGLIGEGVETREEALWLADRGILRQQGFFYARPVLGGLCTSLADRFAALHAAPPPEAERAPAPGLSRH